MTSKRDRALMARLVEPEASCIINSDSGAEVARQIDQDKLITRTMGGLFVEHPDLSQVQQILDVCCGPGGWVLETAFRYPDIEVVGIDYNRNMIDYARAQAKVRGLINAHFMVMETDQSLAFPDNTFDIVNACFINPFLPKQSWPGAVQEFVR